MASLASLFDAPSAVLAARAPSESAGGAQMMSSSASALLSTLIPVAAVAAIYLAIFFTLRTVYPRIYKPREFLASLRKQDLAPALPTSRFGWLSDFFKIDDTYVMNSQTIDAFLILRFLKMAVVTCFVGCIITWPVLFPVNATGPGGQMQLDILSMSNAVSNSNTTSYFRYFAHAGCAWLFFGFVIYMITRESIYYINLRQAYLISPLYSNRVSARTVLFTAVPDAYLNEAVLREMLGPGVVNVWIPRDTSKLEDDVKERDKIAYKLEAAETNLIMTANANRMKAEKKGNPISVADESGDISANYVPQKKRPTHRLKPLIGKKVDTIEWCREQLKDMVPAVDKKQTAFRQGDAKPLNSVFVQFENLRLAQAAFQSVTHHQPLHMAPRYTGIVPSDVIWSNLRIKWWERLVRFYLATTAVTLTVIFWTIPVAIIGAISNVVALENKYSWLAWLKGLPSVLNGLVSGLLPVILMAVLMALLPVYLRLMAKLSGEASYAGVEYVTQNYYFAFQVIQVFLVNSVASGIIASLNDILNNPSSAVTYLAINLPKASNFYISYFILQGLGVVGSTLAAVAGVVIFVVLGKLLDKTPRKQYMRWIGLAAPGFGTLYPIYALLFVIAICYAVIAPLVLGFAVIGLSLFYIAQKYQAIFVWNAQRDTTGIMYARALQHLFVGLYFAEVVLIGLFAIGTAGGVGAIGPLVMMILFLIFTITWHISLNTALDPLLKFLPKSLETEERRLLAMEDMDADAEAAVTGASPTTPKFSAQPKAEFDADGKRNDSAFSQEEERNGYGEKEATAANMAGLPQANKKPNFIQKFMRPDLYTDYYTLRKLVPRQFANINYDGGVEALAYYHPSVTAEVPELWIPRDSMGISRQEVAESGKVIPITDESAVIDEAGKIVWDHENIESLPIYEEKIKY